MTRDEKIALCKAHPGQQAGIARLTGTTSSAVGGFMSRNAKALGIRRKDPDESRHQIRSSERSADAWSERNLTEKWANRQKAREKAGTVYVSKKTGRPGNRWTPEMKAEFARLYKRGISLDKIAAKLGVGTDACKKQRVALKLPERRPVKQKFARIPMHLSLDPEEYLLLRDGAERRGSHMTEYLSFLIKRDAGRVL